MTKKKTGKRKLLMLLDGNAIIHRAFHGVPPLTLADGTPSNAVYGFTSTLFTVLEKFQPDYVVATFDLPGKTFRHDLYPDYKGKRKEIDADLIPQFDLVKEVVRALNIEIAEKQNYEADDVIGTLSVQATAQGVDTVIVTGDRDTLQLVDDHVKVFTMSRGMHDMRLYDAEAVYDKMGVHVAQITDFKGICGDSSDNIPGVKGIGEKGAQQLLGAYGDLDGVYVHIDEVKGAQQKKLIADKEMAYLSRDLGVIALDVSVQLSLTDSESAAIDFDGGREIFEKFQFMSLIKRLDKRKAASGDVDSDTPEKEVKTKKSAKKSSSKSAYVGALDGVLAREYMGIHEGRAVCAVFDVGEDRILGAAFAGIDAAGEPDSAVYIARTDELQAAFDHFVSDLGAQLVVYDAKALWHQIRDRSDALLHVWRDVHLLAYSARTGRKIDRENLVYEVCGSAYAAEEELQMSLASLTLRDEKIATDRLCTQASQIVQVYVQMVAEMDALVAMQDDAMHVWHVFDDIEMPLARILYGMEVAGIAFDETVFARISTATEETLSTLTAEIHDLAGSVFNINSTKQLRTVLFEDLGIPTTNIKKTKTGYSTASSELEKLKELHPIAAKIESYRELFKLKTTYIDTLPLLARADGRIHTTYNQAVTSTGRLSSSDPNLQNIPVRTEAGRALREAFVASEGHILVSADYSQVELRCVAHVADDAAMIKAFRDDADIHTFTSSQVLDKPMESITKEERSRAKELNFGLIYGMGASSFAKASAMSVQEARDFIDRYFTAFHGVRTYMDDTKQRAHAEGFVETLEGRRYYVSGITSKNAMMRAGAERAAINMPIQGLAADIMKVAMIALDDYIAATYPKGEVRMLLQVHDEVILEAPVDQAKEVAAAVRTVMEDAYTLAVPLVVDVEVGQHWGQL